MEQTLIGKGSFSEVYLEDTGEGVVVRKYYKQRYKNEARREYLFLKAVEGPGIVRALGFKDGTEPSITMEYIPGTHPEPGAFRDEESIYAFLARISLTLSRVHAAGISLNDLKPENIILHEDEPVLIDLGLATTQLHRDRHLRGTFAWAAPEKLLYHYNHTPSDIFSLGLIALWLMRNELPADSMDASDWQLVISDRDRLEALVQSWTDNELIVRMLSWDASRRPGAWEAAREFARWGWIDLPDVRPYQIASHNFPVQQKAVEQWFESGRISCGAGDEPDRMINLAVLKAQSLGMDISVLDEELFVRDPEVFIRQLTDPDDDADSNKSFEERLRSLDAVIVKTSSKERMIPLPEDIRVLRIVISPGKSTFSIPREECADFLKNLAFSESAISGILGDYQQGSPMAVRALAGMLEPAKDSIDHEIRDLLCWLGIPLRIDLVMGLWDDWERRLAPLLSFGMSTLQGDRIIVTRGCLPAAEPPQSLVSRMLQLARDHKDMLVAGRIMYLLDDVSGAVQAWEKHVRTMIAREFFVSALAFLQECENSVGWDVLGQSLQKRLAFLHRKNGNPETSLRLYRAIDSGGNALLHATLRVDEAIVLQEMNRSEEAISAYREAAETFRREGQIRPLLRTLNNLGTALFRMSWYRESQRVFQEVLDMVNEHRTASFTSQFEMIALNNLSEVFLQTGAWSRSLLHAGRTAELAVKTGMTAVEKSARVTALTARLAEGQDDKFSDLLRVMVEDPELNENPALKHEIGARCLLLAQIADPPLGLEIANEINPDNLPDDDGVINLFFTFYYHRRFDRLPALISCVRSGENRLFLEAVMRYDFEGVHRYLQRLSEGEEVFRFHIIAVNLRACGIFGEVPEFGERIDRFLRVYPFAPLERTGARDIVKERFPLLWETLSDIHSQTGFKETMNAVLKGLIRIAGMERAVFFRMTGGEPQAEMGFDDHLELLNTGSLRVSRTILSQTLASGSIQYFTGLQEDIPFDIHSSIFGLGLRSAVCYPVNAGQDVKGVIYSDARADRSFGDEDRKLIESVLAQASTAFERNRMIRELSTGISKPEPGMGYGGIIGSSRSMQAVFGLMRNVGSHNINVLITGETGTGKELVARALHQQYAANAPFIAVNCAAIPETLLESELFGHVRGAFTGAVSDRRGRIEEAAGGTLFLDEIGDMPPILQAKLLRVLQERMVTPVGASKPIPVEFRVISATHRDLEAAVKDGSFRSDLLFRLRVVAIELPPLRERIDDIPLLAHYFLDAACRKFDREIQLIDPEAIPILQSREWPGNVRELQNEVERAVLLCEGSRLLDSHFTRQETNPQSQTIFEHVPVSWKSFLQYKKRITRKLESHYIRSLLEQSEGSITGAARLAGMKRAQVYRLLKPEDDTNM